MDQIENLLKLNKTKKIKSNQKKNQHADATGH